jgi:glycosyltransferase involved in cell wall biosynthesis
MVSWAYNEEELIEEFLYKAEKLLESVAVDYEIVLIDDGSTDKTYELATKFQQKNSRLKIFRNGRNLNIGCSSRRGVKEATKEFLFWQTVDWCYDISDLRNNLEYLKKYDVVQGVRINPLQLKGKLLRPLRLVLKLFGITHLTKRSDTIPKAIISVTNYLLVRFLFRVPLADFQNVTVYSTKWIQALKYESNSAFFNPEGLIKSYWSGKSIVEVPIRFIPRTKGIPKGTTPRALFNAVRDIFSLYFKWVLLGKRGEIQKGTIVRHKVSSPVYF